MYKVYCDDVLVHDEASPASEVHLISPRLKMGDCIAGSFECTIPVGTIGYDLFERITSTIAIKKENKTIWTGRVISEQKDFFKRRKITAEGALAYLNDSNQGLQYMQNTSMYQYLLNLLSKHNSIVPVERRIQLGTVTMSDPEEDFIYETEYRSTWEEIDSTCIEKLGGHIRIRYVGSGTTPYLDYYEDYPNTASQEINFGSNLLDFTIDWDLSELATTIIPRGKQLDSENENGQKDYLTIVDVNDGKNYVTNALAYATYGRIEKIVDFSDVEDAAQLLRLAQNYANSMQFDEMTMKVNAIDLHRLNSSIIGFELLDEVRCISRPHGLDKQFPITEVDIPLDNPAGVTYTMGSTQTNSTMSGQSKLTLNSIEQAFKNILPPGNVLDLAKQQATDILNRRTTGYVSIVEQDEQSQALVISDVPEWERATKFWKFDMNGLGYTKNGGQKYDLAITMDGTIVADFIKTGILSDGRGYNFWNMATGEFSLANTAKILDDSGSLVYLNDTINLAQETAERRTGSENYFDGSADWSGWRHAGGWSFDGENAQCAAKNSATLTDLLRPPAKCLKYSTVKGMRLCYSFEGVSDDEWGEIGANNCVMISFAVVNSFNVVVAKLDRLFHLDTMWGRKYTVIEVLDENFTRESGQGSTSFNNMYLDVRMYNKSKHKITVRHIKLERGSVPTDWNNSTVDQEEYAFDAAKAAKKSSMTYTDNQKKALDQSLNQEGVLKRLTNNFKSKGIWLQNKELYINGSYVRTGTLDAGIIKAGILKDARGKNGWNMVTGELRTKDAYFQNAQVNGDLVSGDYYKIHIRDGKMIGKLNNRQVGYIQATAESTYVNTGALWYGLQLQAQDVIRISSPHIAVANSSDVTQMAYVGYTGNVSIPIISDISDNGNGSISWLYSQINIDILNGIITGIAY